LERRHSTGQPRNGHESIAEVLLEKGAFINASAYYGTLTAQLIALKHDGNVNAISAHGHQFNTMVGGTPLQEAAASGREKVDSQSGTTGHTALSIAATNGNTAGRARGDM
jgi:ankyrin repeat protein